MIKKGARLMNQTSRIGARALAALFFVLLLATACTPTPPPLMPSTSPGIVGLGDTPLPGTSLPSVEDMLLDDAPTPTPDLIPPPRWILAIGGAEVTELSSREFDVLPQTSAEIEGAVYDGVLLMDVLAYLKLAPGGTYTLTNAEGDIVLAADNILSPDTLLTDKKNGEAFGPPEGPVLLVVGEKFDLWLPGVLSLAPAADSAK